MIKQQKIARRSTKTKALVVDNRTPKAPPSTPDLSVANQPIRTVNLVEVHDMDRNQITVMLQQLSKLHDSAVGGIHYFLPVRNGKISSDILFEQEWMSLVRKICEVDENGQIVLKGGAKETLVIRQSI